MLYFTGAPMMKTPNLTFAIAALAVTFAAPAHADVYPVSGRWTYENASAAGPATSCGSRYMEFSGQQRIDTGGGVPGYRNARVAMVNSQLFLLTDQFNNGQMRGREEYSLSLIDEDHIQLRIKIGGKSILLRRCG